MKIKWSKIFLIVLFVLMSSGFALLDTYNWNISKSDPTIWIKPCDEMKNYTWTSNNIVDSSDTLKSITNPTYTQVIDTIISDYNNIQDSYIRVAKYPDDPNNPGAPSAGDSTFTIAKGNVRTVQVCFSDSGTVNSSGNASRKKSGSTITSCEIKIKNDVKPDLNFFVHVLTHEIGHCLGLDHPMDTSNAIMSYFSSNDDIRLKVDDKMGLTYLFPEDATKGSESNTFGLSCTKR